MELIDSNWNVQNWITGNQNDGFVYDGCAAFQKVLDGKLATPMVQLGPNHLAPKRPLSAKHFRESFFALKFT